MLRDVITNLLGQVPSLFAPNKKPEPCLLPALDAALLALAPTGGKIVASLSTLPTSGPGKLFMRDNKKGAGTDNEKKLYTTEHPGWRKTATKLVESGVGLDLFLGSSGSFMDVGTIGKITSQSSLLTSRLTCHQATLLQLAAAKFTTTRTLILREIP